MGALSIGLVAVMSGIALRQADRWWFSPARGRHTPDSLRSVMRLQRERLNDVTPVLLLLGHWLEFGGWCAVAVSGGPGGCAVAALAGAVKFRHLQEVSHFAVHGVLVRGGRLNTLLAEVAVHVPLGFVPVSVRRRRHVREHHPNATVTGADPNLAELHAAGLRPGATAVRYARALIHPCTPAGVHGTVRSVAGLRREGATGRLRAAGPVAVTAALVLAFGWEAAVFAFVLPRLLLYPQLAWMSLLVEHRWFDPEAVPGPPVAVEAGRCLRLYPRNAFLALLARGTWLPYGDLYHFAHSAHPAVRWNYLPALECTLRGPAYRPHALLLGESAVLRRHRRALTPAAGAAVGPSRQNSASEDTVRGGARTGW